MDYRFGHIPDDFGDAFAWDITCEAALHAARKLLAEEERWIWKAMAEGVGNRVWRSHALAEPWPGTSVSYRFKVLRPGDSVPGAGIVFGPFSKAPCTPGSSLA
jgi:hypothetical protein